MEFFRIIKSSANEQSIKSNLDFKHLELMSSQLFLLEPLNDHLAKVGTLWGEFTLTRQEVKGGLRFSLLECPNALTWTITSGYEPAPDSMIVHLTINRTEIDQDFLEEIQEFIEDHCDLLKETFSTLEKHN